MLQQPRVGAELGLVRNTLGRLPIVPAPVVEVTVRNDAGERTCQRVTWRAIGAD